MSRGNARRFSDYRLTWKECDKLLKDGSTELPAAGARRIGFQLHMILKDGSSFDEALDAIHS